MSMYTNTRSRKKKPIQTLRALEFLSTLLTAKCQNYLPQNKSIPRPLRNPGRRTAHLCPFECTSFSLPITYKPLTLRHNPFSGTHHVNFTTAPSFLNIWKEFDISSPNFITYSSSTIIHSQNVISLLKTSNIKLKFHLPCEFHNFFRFLASNS